MNIVEQIKQEIERLISNLPSDEFLTDIGEAHKFAYKEVLSFLNTIQEPKNLWHDPQEELPKDDSHILCVTSDGKLYDSCWYNTKYCNGFARITFSNIADVYAIPNVKKWCYLSDVIKRY